MYLCRRVEGEKVKLCADVRAKGEELRSTQTTLTKYVDSLHIVLHSRALGP